MDDNVRFRLAEMERRLDDLREDMDEKHREVMNALSESNASNAELLNLFNGGKAALSFVRGVGKVTIAFSAFMAALGAVWVIMKALFFWSPK
jgi:hypothetical protein